jgi:hypothetical protein
VLLFARSEAKGRPRPVRDLAEKARGAGDFAWLSDVWTSEGWRDPLIGRWPSGSGLEDSVGNTGLARGRRRSLAGDGYGEVLNGGGREPLVLVGRSLRRLERYSTVKRKLVLPDATLGSCAVDAQVLTFLLVRHEGWLGRRDLALEVSKTVRFMQHLGRYGRACSQMESKERLHNRLKCVPDYHPSTLET